MKNHEKAKIYISKNYEKYLIPFLLSVFYFLYTLPIKLVVQCTQQLNTDFKFLLNKRRKRSQSAGPGSKVFDKLATSTSTPSMGLPSSSSSNSLLSASLSSATSVAEGGGPEDSPRLSLAPPKPTPCELRVAQYEKPLTKGHCTKKTQQVISNKLVNIAKTS